MLLMVGIVMFDVGMSVSAVLSAEQHISRSSSTVHGQNSSHSGTKVPLLVVVHAPLVLAFSCSSTRVLVLTSTRVLVLMPTMN